MPSTEPRTGVAVAGMVLGGFAIAGAVALVTAPITPRMAVAQPTDRADAEPATNPRLVIPASATRRASDR